MNLKNQIYLTTTRVEISMDMPLGEIVFDFYDKLKSISKGYASFDYHLIGYQPAKLVKLDILLNGESVDALSTLNEHSNCIIVDGLDEITAYEKGIPVNKILAKLPKLPSEEVLTNKIDAAHRLGQLHRRRQAAKDRGSRTSGLRPATLYGLSDQI